MAFFNRNRTKILLVFFILVFFSIGLYLFYFHKRPQVIHSKQVKYSFTVKNKTNMLLNKGALWVYGPVETSAQSCTNIDVSLPFEIKIGPLGNHLLRIPISELPPFSTRMIHITATLDCITPPLKIKISDRELYLAPEPGLESDHPDLILQARKLAGSTEEKTARNIFNWVSSTIKYSGYTKNNRGALYAISQKKGDCTEFMSLFVALCRAGGIPARGIGGYLCTGNCILNPSDYHNWAEAYLNKTWVTVDCQRKRFAPTTGNYIAMNIISAHAAPAMGGYQRFRYQGTGTAVHMNH